MIDYPDRDDTELRAVDSVWLVLHRRTQLPVNVIYSFFLSF